MKIKLQTMLKHNWRTLLLLLTLITVSQGVWGTDYYLRGEFNDWGSDKLTLDDGWYKSPFYQIDYNQTKRFKITDNTSWSGAEYWDWEDSPNKGNISCTTAKVTSGDNGITIKDTERNGFVQIWFSSASGKCAYMFTPFSIAGNMNSWNTGDTSYAMSWDGTYYSLSLGAKSRGNVVELKVVRGRSWDDASYNSLQTSSPSNYSLYGTGEVADNNVKMTFSTAVSDFIIKFSTDDKIYMVIPCIAPTASNFAISNNTYTYDGNTHRATVTSNTVGYSPASITWGHGANSGSTASNKTTAGTYGTYVLTASASGDYCAVTSAISTSVGNLIIEKADQAELSISTTPTTKCMGNTFTLATSGGSGGGAVTYAITGGTGSGSISGTTLSASAAGTIIVTATKAASTNFNEATADKTFTFNANPSKPTIKSYTTSVCSSGTPTFTVASSTGLTYQMYTGGSTSGSSVAGEDSKDKTLTAAAITSATSYVMRATNGNGCYAESDAASVTITPDMALTSITLTPSNICVGGTSEVSLTGLNVGGAGVVTYTSGTPAVATIAAKDPATAGATASGVSVGTSIITATVSGGCGSAPDPKTATLNVKAAPTAYTLSASGESEAYICSAGGTLTLSGSQSGYSYQLKKDGSASGTAKTGTGSTLEFTVYESGEYTCEAYLTDSPDCKTDMTGTVILHISLTPVLLPATPTVKNYEPVTITSINTDIETWTISNAGNTAYLYNITSNSATVKASKANSPYTVTATTPGGCSSTVTVTVGDYTETCAP